MPIKFRCPKCRQAYSISSKKAGSALDCQKCGSKIRIPTLDDPPEAASPKPKKTPAEPVDQRPAAASPASGVEASAPRRAEVSRELQQSFSNLLDDDDFEDIADGDAVESAASAAAPDADAGGDLDAVLDFEKALEDDGEVAATRAPVYIPDELYGDDGEEDEEDGKRESRSGSDEEMDLTPMVDVTFLLLIFFMITASFSIQKTLEVPPPDPEEKGASTSQKLEDIKEQSVEVHIDSRNIITINDEPLPDPSLLVDKLRQESQNEILITAHENSMHDMLVKVIDAAQEVGMQKIRVGVTRGLE